MTKPTAAELAKLHISQLRKMVKDDPSVSPIAKANRIALSKDQLILNLTGDPEVAARVKAKMGT